MKKDQVQSFISTNCEDLYLKASKNFHNLDQRKFFKTVILIQPNVNKDKKEVLEKGIKINK